MTKSLWGIPPWRTRCRVPAVPLPDSCEVAVVGGGSTGLATAHALARKGVEGVAVFEANSIGAGASGRSGGIVLEGTASGPPSDLEGCITALERLVTDAAIECELELGGCWELCHEHSAAQGTRLWRDGDEDLAIAAMVAGGTLNPGALVEGLTSSVTAAGVTIHERARVTAFEPGTRSRLYFENHVVTAASVVFALNAYTPTLLQPSADFYAALTLALCTTPLDGATLEAVGLGEGRPFYTQDLPYLWGRPLRDGRLIFGSGLVFGADHSLEDIDIRRGDAADLLAAFERRVHELHPALASVGVDTRWAGPVAFLPSRAPIISRLPNTPSVIATGAYAGHGVALSIRLGELAAAAIVEGTPLPPWGAIRF